MNGEQIKNEYTDDYNFSIKVNEYFTLIENNLSQISIDNTSDTSKTKFTFNTIPSKFVVPHEKQTLYMELGSSDDYLPLLHENQSKKSYSEYSNYFTM